MAGELASIDLADMPELADMIEQIVASGEPRQLRRGNQVLAVLSPPNEALATADRGAAPGPPSDPSPRVRVETDIRMRHEMTPEEYAAFKAAAGSLEGLLDVDELHGNLEESRRLSISKTKYYG